MIGVGRSLVLGVVAEEVKPPGQSDFLYQEGCGKAQGYYFNTPLLAEDFA